MLSFSSTCWALVLGVTLAASAACARPITPSELYTFGSRRYAGRSTEELVAASSVALKTLGYRVIVADATTGRVKTAPKTIVVQAADGEPTTTTNASMTWTLEVTPAREGANGIEIHAMPQTNVGGRELPVAGNATVDYMQTQFSELWKEIDDSLQTTTDLTDGLLVGPAQKKKATP